MSEPDQPAPGGPEGPNTQDQDGLGVGPAAGAPDFSGPGFLPRDQGAAQPPVIGPPTPYQGQYGQQQGQYGLQQGQYGQQPNSPEGRPRRGRARVMIIVGVAAVVLVVVAALAVRAFHRPVDEKPRASPSASTPPSSQPSSDAFGKALETTGLVCVRAVEQPVIHACSAKPSASYSSFRWIDDGQGVAGFQVYARAGTSYDGQVLKKRITLLRKAGIADADLDVLDGIMIKAKNVEGRTMDSPADWGTISVTYLDADHSYNIRGQRSGAGSMKFHGRSLHGSTAKIIKQLKPQDYRCKKRRDALLCTKKGSSLNFYSRGNSGYNYLAVGGLRSSETNEAILGLLPMLIGSTVQPVETMIKSNLSNSFYLGASSGYLVEISSTYLTLEGVSW